MAPLQQEQPEQLAQLEQVEGGLVGKQVCGLRPAEHTNTFPEKSTYLICKK